MTFSARRCFQFIHTSVKMSKILHIIDNFCHNKLLKIHKFKFKDTQITFNDTQFL